MKLIGLETRCYQRVGVNGRTIKIVCVNDTTKDYITCGDEWKVILGSNANRDHKQQVLLAQGNLQTIVV
jgi:hypothetical protein